MYNISNDTYASLLRVLEYFASERKDDRALKTANQRRRASLLYKRLKRNEVVQKKP